MTTRARTILGAIAWIAFFAAAHTSPTAPAWAEVMLAFSALVLMPLVLDLVSERRDTGKIGRSMTWARYAQLPAAALLALACGMRPGLWAMLVAIPWAAVTALLASVGFSRILRDKWSRPIDRLSTDVGLVYLLIGGVWVLADRGGLRPLNLDPTIVGLTAVHFHFAGFVLPIFGGLILRQSPDSRFAARAVVGVVLGVPAVALGITGTQLGWSPSIEAAAACALALSGMALGILQVRWALDTQVAPPLARVLIGFSGTALFFAMILAGAYGVRSFAAPLPWLGLPQMRAIHGMLNAIGFALCGALGWKVYAAAPAKAEG